jgi:hypothetical protein
VEPAGQTKQTTAPFGASQGRERASLAFAGRTIGGVGLALWVAGCALTQEVSKTPRSATEQLLLTQAVERALEGLAVPLSDGATIRVEVSGLQTDRAHLHLDEEVRTFGVIDSPSWDLGYLRDMVAGRLGELGFVPAQRDEEAAYLARIMVQSMGTNQEKTFFGMPPIQSVLIPFSLPALTLYQELGQLAHVRLHLDLYEAATGRYIRRTDYVSAKTYYNQYTVFFFFTFRSTDLVDPP